MGNKEKGNAPISNDIGQDIDYNAQRSHGCHRGGELFYTSADVFPF